MAITITEKQHWKERIEARINKRIEHLKSGNPQLFVEVADQARVKAVASLGIKQDHAALVALEKKEKDLELQKKALIATLYQKLTGECSAGEYWVRSKIDGRISEQQAKHQDELLLSHELGREIARLNSEKENLLDTVWLATSPRQVTDLWQKVITLLGDQTTEFQREVLSSKESPET
jgi:hypothetical protein